MSTIRSSKSSGGGAVVRRAIVCCAAASAVAPRGSASSFCSCALTVAVSSLEKRQIGVRCGDAARLPAPRAGGGRRGHTAGTRGRKGWGRLRLWQMIARARSSVAYAWCRSRFRCPGEDGVDHRAEAPILLDPCEFSQTCSIGVPSLGQASACRRPLSRARPGLAPGRGRRRVAPRRHLRPTPPVGSPPPSAGGRT